MVGEKEGMPEGSKVGELEGLADGIVEGFALGIFVGIMVGTGVLTYAMVSFSSLDSDRPSVKTGTYTILIASPGRLEGEGVWKLATSSSSSSDAYSMSPASALVGMYG